MPEKPSKIIILEAGDPVAPVRARRGAFPDLIRDAIGDAWHGDYAVVPVRADDVRLPSPSEAAAFVITGSAASVPDREPWMLRTEAWLRELCAEGTPTFGICFGHQMLAQALGGEVQRNPRGREMGTVAIERIADDPIFAGVPARFHANVTHVDTVVRLPEGATALSRSALESHHVIRFNETSYGVQYHPEFDGEVMRTYVEARREILEGESFSVDVMLAEVGEGEMGRATLRNFVRRFVATPDR